MVTLPKRHHDGEVELSQRRVGNAIVVHQPGGMSDAARTLALSVAEDVEHDLVVVDLPVGSPASVWDGVARVLPRRRKGVRLVIGGRARETTALVGRLLAEQLHRPVVAHDGAIAVGADGSLLVDSGPHSGWVRFEPGRKAPRWAGKRFPRPFWDIAALADMPPTSAAGIVEALPGGVWIRPPGPPATQHAQRSMLVGSMSCQQDVLTVVLGAPHTPPLSCDDAARLLMRLPEDVRTATRFVHYGTLNAVAGAVPGQALANLVGLDVSWYNGMPTGGAAIPVVRTVTPDGTLGWRQYATELTYQPNRSGAPLLTGFRPPVPGLTETAPGIYWYSPDAVVEVVQSGLLVRSPADADRMGAVRAVPADSLTHHLTFDADGIADPDRMYRLAADLMARLDPDTRRVTHLLPAAALVGARARITVPGGASGALGDVPVTVNALFDEQPTQVLEAPGRRRSTQALGHRQAQASGQTQVVATTEPSRHARGDGLATPALPAAMRLESTTPAEPATEADETSEAVAAATVAIEAPSPPPPPPAQPLSPPKAPDERIGANGGAGAVVAQRTPAPNAVALLSADGVDEERAWLRRTLGPQFGTISNSIARVLSEHPGFQGAMALSSADVVTDAVAVHYYLSGQGAVVDTLLRAGEPGAHVPLARCVVAGLSRLPSHRGPSLFATTVPSSAWEHYQRDPVVTDWGFVHALVQPRDLTGDTDVVVWSMTARRTRLLEPQADPVPERVLFVPGTAFKVLELAQPTESGRGLILMRELAAAEVDERGRGEETGELDELALEAIRRQRDAWAAGASKPAIGAAAAPRFDALPGLVRLPGATA